MKRIVPLAALGCTPLASLVAADPVPAADAAMIDIVLQLEDGMRTTHDQPRIVMWLEDRNKRFVRTLYRFGQKDPKHYEDLPVSFALYSKAETQADLDAVTGATVTWGSQGRVRLPSRWRGLDLLSGRFVLRVESAKDHAKHFPGVAIPLNAKAVGKTFTDSGYVRSVEISNSPADSAAADHPVMIPVPPAAAPQLAAGQVETAVAVGTVIAITPATNKFPNMPSVTLKLDGSGDIVEYWPRKQQRETDEITRLILACKKGMRKQVVYTESKGSRAIELSDAPP